MEVAAGRILSSNVSNYCKICHILCFRVLLYPGIAKLGQTRSYSDFPGDFVVKCEATTVQPGQLLASCYHPSCCRACPQHGDCFGEMCKMQSKYPGGDTEGEVHRD